MEEDDVGRMSEGSPETPAAAWKVALALLARLPERGLSRGFGRLADIPIPGGMRRTVLGAFARAVGADLTEVERPLDEYPTLNAFFVRRLRQGVREWPSDPGVIASPVDGIVGRFGHINGGWAIQAKGHDYSIGDLLADPKAATRHEGGLFITIYLSPRHYHRIHTPCAGSISRATYVPGALLPVNVPAVMHVPGLFARNERLVCHLDGAGGSIAVVAVGAYNVGRISAAFDPGWTGTGREPWVTNMKRPSPIDRVYDPPRLIETGAEIMAFHLGSTIVMLLDRASALAPGIEPGREVKVGQALTI